MAVNPELLRALAVSGPIDILGDVPGLFEDPFLEEEAFKVERDPALEVLLKDPAVDPELKQILRETDDERRFREHQEKKIEKIEQELGDKPPTETAFEHFKRTGPIAFLGPVPLGFQLGTFFGVKNPITRFLVDVIADPIFLITGGAGGLTALGRGSAHLLRAGKALSPANKAFNIVKGARMLGRLKKGDPEMVDLARHLRRSAVSWRKTGDPRDARTIIQAFKKLSKKPLTDDELAKIAQKGGDPTLAALLRGEKKELRGLKNAFTAMGKFQKAEEAAGFLDAVIKGQRSFLTFGIPFTDIELATLRFPGLLKALRETGVIGKTAKVLKDAAKGAITLKASTPHIGESLDARKTIALMNENDDVTTNLEKLADGRLSVEKWGTDDYIKSPQGTVNISMAELDGWEKGRQYKADLWVDLTSYDKSLRAIIPEILSNPKIQNISDDPRFLKLPEHLQGVTMRERIFLDRIGQTLMDSDSMAHFRANYFTLFLKKTQNPAQKHVSAIHRSLAREGLPRELDKKLKDVKGLIDEGTPESLFMAQEELFDVMRARFVKGTKRQAGIPTRFSWNRFFEDIKAVEKFLEKNPGAFEIVSKEIHQIIPKYLQATGGALTKTRMLRGLRGAVVDDNALEALNLPRTAVLHSDDIARLRPGDRRRLNQATAPEGTKGRALKDFRYQKVESQSNVFDDYIFHSSIAPHMRALLNSSWYRNMDVGSSGMSLMAQGIDMANNIAKASLFNLNPFFHSMALTMSNFALLPPNVAIKNTADVWRMLKATAFNTDPDLAYDIMLKIMSRTRNVAGDDVFTEFMLSPTKLGRAQIDADQAFNVIDNLTTMALNAVDPASVLTHPIRGLKHYNMLSDRALWQVTQNMFKTLAWAHIRHDALKKAGPNVTKSMRFKINTEAGNIVNQAFGGLAWERLGIQPNAQKFWRFALLAPDWTFSNLLMARDLFLNIPAVRNSAFGKAITRDVILRDMRFHWAMQYNVRAAAYLWMGSNLFNYLSTEWRTGKGRWLWDNDEEAVDRKTGLKTRIEMPWLRDDGRRQFMDLFRQFTEPLALILNPAATVESKIGPLPRLTKTVVWGTDSFGNPVAGAEDGPYKDLMLRFGEAGSQFFPIPLQQAGRVARGELPAVGLALSTIGFPISSESMKGFQQRGEIERLKEELRRGRRLTEEEQEQVEEEIRTGRRILQ
jgi:arsenate reductase-like glutaredoxin family protein